MPKLTAPVKTPLGQEELRSRTHGLGQRYRTVLLLVDGRRPLGEVLAMAHQAGAQTSHFEELVRMGLVDVPEDAAAPEPTETAPGALDTPRLTSVEFDVTDESLTPMGELLPEPDDGLVAEPEAQTQAQNQTHNLPVIEVSRIAPAPEQPQPPAAPRYPSYQEPVVTISATLREPDWMQVREAPFKVADHARPAPSMSEEERLQYVRDILLDTLRRDALLFATFATSRVRNAKTHRDLITLVWEIERDRGHARRTRDQLLNLQRARELLGMGNTLVAGDSQPGRPSEY